VIVVGIVYELSLRLFAARLVKLRIYLSRKSKRPSFLSSYLREYLSISTKTITNSAEEFFNISLENIVKLFKDYYIFLKHLLFKIFQEVKKNKLFIRTHISVYSFAFYVLSKIIHNY